MATLIIEMDGGLVNEVYSTLLEPLNIQVYDTDDIPRRSPKGHVTGSGYYITGRLLKYKQPYIHTDQTAFLRTELFDMGYRIFLHYANGAVMEIKLGDNPQPVGPLTASSDLQSILFPDGHLKHPVIC